MTDYSLSLAHLTDKEAFIDASKEELRVLLALIECGGIFTDADALSLAAKTSKARTAASIIYWEESGVITKKDGTENDTVKTVTEEFEERVFLGRITERSADIAAREIRDNNLADLLSECAMMMKKPALSTEEAKLISALYTQYALDEEYIITLAAYLSEKDKLTAQRLGAEAERLIKREIDSVDKLLEYLKDKDEEIGEEWEFKKLVGIQNRNLTKKEKEYIKRWYLEFAFGNEIISEAFSISGKLGNQINCSYMDKILTRWHEAGCRTVNECKILSERDKAEMDAQAQEKKPPSIPRKKPTPRYGEFDVNEAFEKALLRSYGEESDK